MANLLPRVKWAVIDGLPFWLLKKYLDDASMPNLARLMAQGAITPLEPLWPNCQTPPSLFSIWSGQPATTHGIWGFDTPHGEQPGAFRNGFTHWPASVEMVWETWARAGYDVRLNHIPFVDEAKLGDRLVARSAVYGETLYDSRLFTGSMCLSLDRYDVTLTLQPLDERQALLHVDGECIRFTQKLDLDVFNDIALPAPLKGALTLMPCRSDAGRLQGALLGKNHYYRSGREPARTGHPPEADFCHVSLAKLYRNNELGLKKGQGGQGNAEKKLFASLARVHQSFSQELKESFAQQDADLTVGYYPVIDLALHEILNLEHMAQEDDEIAGYFWKVMAWAETVVAALAANCREDEILIINSDHGMQPISDIYYLNHYLALHGWLVFDEKGEIDYANTRAAYHPAENGTLLIHEACDASLVCERVCAFFSEAGLEGARVVRLPQSERQQAFDTGWFLQPPDGVRVKASASAIPVRLSDKAGDHCGYSPLSDLKGTLISTHGGARPSLMQMYDIKAFILDN
ncbi:alkaline phosphatase family protein [Erwinia sp. BNK-24-b]|uniref:alkaline phosphatase family protein n=1 Tax=unclassified Erwinia TaxID=2622719 RepID=UPI0039BF8836